MKMLSRLSLIAVFGAVAACGDQTGPQVDDSPVFAKGGRKALSQPVMTMLRHSPDAPPLMSYDTSFTAVQGERTEFVLHYVNPYVVALSYDRWELVGSWFMRVSIPKDAELLDETGLPAAVGDSVEITVLVDQEQFLVEFGPHGSTFLGKKPALLEFSLEFAELVELDPDMLDIWYRADAMGEWNALGTRFDKRGTKLQAPIHHFSGYAVAW
jgi:hypothetical protein